MRVQRFQDTEQAATPDTEATVGDPTTPWPPGYKGLSVLLNCRAYFPWPCHEHEQALPFVSAFSDGPELQRKHLLPAESSSLKHHYLYSLQNTYVGYQNYRLDGLAWSPCCYQPHRLGRPGRLGCVLTWWTEPRLPGATKGDPTHDKDHAEKIWQANADQDSRHSLDLLKHMPWNKYYTQWNSNQTLFSCITLEGWRNRPPYSWIICSRSPLHLHDDLRATCVVMFYKVLSPSERFALFPLMWWSEVYRFLNTRSETILKKKKKSFSKHKNFYMLQLPRNLWTPIFWDILFLD